jgi:UDP-2-acetamido-2,6-beta-L-arabino-hexul-4-ose reductase
MRVKIKPVTVNRDRRGSVFEPLTADNLAAQRNVHVVLTEPGAVRGNHYHRRGTEVMTVYGPALIRARDQSEHLELEVADGEAVRLTIPPGVAHAVKNTGSAPIVLVAFNTQEHDCVAPDVVREVLIET